MRWCSRSPSRNHSSARIIVADYLPAGFEIDNPRLVSSGDAGTLAWIENAQEPVNAEFRDDRFSAAFERKSGDASVFTIAYVVRAVSPGHYIHPQAYVEDMYGRTASAVPPPVRSRSRLRSELGNNRPGTVQQTIDRHAPDLFRPSTSFLVSEQQVVDGGDEHGHDERGSGSGRPRARLILAAAVISAAILGGGAAWIISLGPAPMGQGLAFSTVVVDREGRLLRPYTTPEGRWRLAATREHVDPRFLDSCLPTRTSGSTAITELTRSRCCAVSGS